MLLILIMVRVLNQGISNIICCMPQSRFLAHFSPIVPPHLWRHQKTFFFSLRTSTGTFLKQSSDETIQNIEKRIATITTLPAENGECPHVLHYGVGEQYVPHFDYLHPTPALKYGGQRVATFLMYLSDVEGGGETEFPWAQSISSFPPDYSKLVDTCKGLKVKPKMGNALLFWNAKSDGRKDPYSEHGSCPVIKGEKWVCTKWIRAFKFQVRA